MGWHTPRQGLHYEHEIYKMSDYLTRLVYCHMNLGYCQLEAERLALRLVTRLQLAIWRKDEPTTP